VSAAISNFLIFEYQPPALRNASRYSTPAFKIEKGFIEIPDVPGLGVTMDEAAMKQFVAESFVIRS
jgi:L-alanine-DL-glutamate epimerase-like enolase superfamily enzyme